MRNLILATKSKARRQLLKQLGVKFSVDIARVDEQITHVKGCGRLVVSNAINKAKAVAQRNDSGVVLAADTVVLSDREIIGKPKNEAQATIILKKLCSNPHWVYTGVAVIDVFSKELFTDYCKTKVWMSDLTDSEIKRYIRKASPFDKAGSFDIQGLGAVLVQRIEGCYYNVVGLPLNKTVNLLKKAGIEVF